MKKKKRFAKIVLMCLCAALLLSSCGDRQTTGKQAKVSITVAEWPDDTNPSSLATYEGYLKKFNEKYPDIEIVRDTSVYDPTTYMAKASSGQLATIYLSYFTEINKIINAGYGRDITEAAKKYGYDRAMNPELLKMISKDNKMYAVPSYVYTQGLYLNKNLFKQAGLVNEDGTLQYPSTYDELVDFAKQIKEKTGKAGYVIPAMQHAGGWHFMNIAWSYGVEFMKEENGKWIATFNTPECVQALQYVKDLKWKHNVLPENVFIDKSEMEKLFATDQVGMCFFDPPGENFMRLYGMKADAAAVVRMPEGPKGRYTQMGGTLTLFSPKSTDEELDAAFKWLEVVGTTPNVNDDIIASWDAKYKQDNQDNVAVLDQEPFKIWVSKDRVEAENEIRRKYMNIYPRDYQEYYSFADIAVRSEEPVCCQDLYELFDSCIQEVLTNENSDVAAVVAKAAEDFQHNHLDKWQG